MHAAGEGDVLDGLAAADARIGGRFPVPDAALPVARWVEVRALGPRGAQVEWNLDDSRAGAPGRLALYAGRDVPPPQLPLDGPGTVATSLGLSGRTVSVVRVPLEEAQASLRPVIEVSWAEADMHLRLTAQGPWPLEDVLAIAASVHATNPPAA
jgi:hypothetical protein